MNTVVIDFSNLVNAFSLPVIFAGVGSMAVVMSLVPMARKGYEVVFAFIASK